MAVNYKIGADASSFKQGVSEAQASLKTLDAALKVNEASFKAGGDAQIYMQQKTQLLNDKMTKQKQLVTQLQQGLRQMRENGVAPTSTAYQQMEQKMLNAQTAMLETKTAIDNLDESQQQAANSAGDLANSVNSIGKKISLDQVISGINSITGAMETAAGKAVQLGETIWSNVMDSAKWADDTATMALMYGVDLDTFLRVQKLVQNGMDTSVEAILKSQQKLTKNVGTGSDSFMQTLVDLGLAVQTYGKNGEVATEVTDDATALFWKAGQALMAMDDEFEKESKAQELFGKSWRELIPLFSEFANQDEYNQALKDVKVNSEEDVSALAELNDKVGELKGNLQTLSNEVWATLAPALTDAAEALNGVLENVMAYLETPEGQQALKDMETAVSGLFDDLGKIDPDQVVEGFSKVFNTVVESLQWLTEHSDDVVNALKIIVAGWAGLKLTGGALTILELINGIKGLTGAAGASAVGAGASGASAAGASAAGSGAGVAAAKSGIFTKIKSTVSQSALAGLAGKIGSTISSADPFGVSGLILPWLSDNTVFGRNIRDGGTIQEAAQASFSSFAEYMSSVPNRLTSWYHESYWDDIVDKVATYFGDMGGAWDQYFGWKGDTSRSYSNTLEEALTEAQSAFDDFFHINRVEAETEPVVVDGAAESVAQQVGTVEIPTTLVVNGISTGGGSHYSIYGGAGGSMFSLFGNYFHANGLSYVPFDNYPALLHKGEEVKTAREAGSRSYNSNLYVEKMYMNNGVDAQALANKMAAAQRRRVSGYGG